MKQKISKILSDYAVITLGAALVGLGYVLFLVDNRIASGGFTGIATVIYHFWNFPVGITVLVMNVPLLIIAIFVLGRDLGLKTVYGMVALSAAIDAFSFMPIMTEDLLLASIMGGAVIGAGLGLIFRMGATTGGTDLAARLVHRFFPIVAVGKFLLFFDIMVVLLSALAFKSYELGLYAGLSIFVTSKVLDTVLVGVDYTKAVYIISDHSQTIADRILKELDRGVTGLNGKGMYTQKEREILLCVMRPRNLMRMKRIVKEVDPRAFVFISDVRDVFGEGFHPYLD